MNAKHISDQADLVESSVSTWLISATIISDF